jgi:hypothetical protein
MLQLENMLNFHNLAMATASVISTRAIASAGIQTSSELG